MDRFTDLEAGSGRVVQVERIVYADSASHLTTASYHENEVIGNFHNSTKCPASSLLLTVTQGTEENARIFSDKAAEWCVESQSEYQYSRQQAHPTTSYHSS